MKDHTPSAQPVARQTGLVIQEHDDEVLIYDLDAGEAHCLNSSAAFVWRSCSGGRSVEEIVREFEKSGLGPVSEDFVWLALDQLSERRLLDMAPAKRFAGMSRRDAVKKVGLAAAVALPVVASLTAPPSVLATGSCACLVPADCAAQAGCPSMVNCNASGVCAP